MPPVIRPATPADLPAITALVQAAYAPYTARIGRPPGPMGDDYATLVAAGRVHVANRDGRVDGLVVLIPEPEAMLLDNVAVAPSAQGQGLGRALLRFAEEAARAAGLHTLRLYTNAAMTENIALYTRCGFRRTHQAEEKGFARVFMAKALTPSHTPAENAAGTDLD